MPEALGEQFANSMGPEAQLRPTRSEISIAGFCTIYLFVCSLIGPFIIPFVRETGIVSLLGFGNILAILFTAIIFIRYRLRRRRTQGLLDRLQIRSLGDGASFALYLRPFVTGGRLLCRNTLDRAGERSILGRVWDAELNFAMALLGAMRFVGVGGRHTGYGAAKLLLDQEEWQAEVRRLARAAKLIIAVPMAKAGTLWEIRQVFEEDQLRLKTLFFMPPMLRRPTRAWRLTRAHRKLWNEARHSLKLEHIYLPAYQRIGCIFMLGRDGHALEVFPLAAGFSTSRVRQLFETVLDAGRGSQSALDDELLRSALIRLPQPVKLHWFRRYSLKRVTIGAMLWGTVAAWSVALPFRSLVFEPFNIPSVSMSPTLLAGDYLFVSKYSYGYSYASLPFGPHLFSGRVPDWMPARGDVAVFKWPGDNSTDYIKRVIGLPGDRVQVRKGQLYINGAMVPRQPEGDYAEEEGRGGPEVLARRYAEALPGGVTHDILKTRSDTEMNNTPEVRVLPGFLFVMGDNRDNSADSRMPVFPDPQHPYLGSGGVGLLPAENLVGKAELIFFSFDARDPWWQFWEWPFEVRWGRLLHGIP